MNRFPIVAETAATANPEIGQLVPMNNTAWGHMTGWETDWYAVELAKGQRCSLDVLGLRISPTDLDLIMQVLRPNGTLLQEQDTSLLYYHDPVCSFIAPEAGRYRISLRENGNGTHQNDPRYGMASDCLYVMHVGDYPQPHRMFPLGGVTGQEIEVQMDGDVHGPIWQKIKVPVSPSFNFAPMRSHPVPSWCFDRPETLLPFDGASLGTGPLFYMASPQPSVLEASASHATQETAQVLPTPPFAVEGRIGKVDEKDWFRFPLPAGKSWRIDVFGRRLRSPIDPVLTFFPDANKTAAPQENDDRAGYDVDSTLIVKGAGTEVAVRVADSRGAGGSEFGYRLVVDEARPLLNLTTAPVERLTLLDLFKTGHSISVPRGGRSLLLLQLEEDAKNLKEVLDIAISNLPPGVTAEYPKNVGGALYPVVLKADANAALSGSFARIAGKSIGSGLAVPFAQRQGMVYSHPAQTAWHTERFDSLAVAVVDALPYSIAFAPKAEGVEAGTKAVLKLLITRAPGAAPQPLTVFFPGLGPIGNRGSQEISGDATEATVELEVPAACAPGDWPIAVAACDSDFAHQRAHGWPYYYPKNDEGNPVNVQGYHWISSPLIYLRVLPASKN